MSNSEIASICVNSDTSLGCYYFPVSVQSIPLLFNLNFGKENSSFCNTKMRCKTVPNVFLCTTLFSSLALNIPSSLQLHHNAQFFQTIFSTLYLQCWLFTFKTLLKMDRSNKQSWGLGGNFLHTHCLVCYGRQHAQSSAEKILS